MPRVSDQFSLANRVRFIHRIIQGLLAVFLVLQLNYFGMTHYVRYDVTQNHFFTLSPETRAHLRELDEPIKIIVTTPKNSPQRDVSLLYEYTENLLEQYDHALREMGQGDLVQIEYVNIYRDLERMRDLANKYGVEDENLIVVAGPERTRVLTPTDLFDFEDMEAEAFKGEQALTTALLEITTANRPTIYFTVGHGEMRLDDVSQDRGLSELASALNEKNFAIGHLDLSQESVIPDDADLIICADPRGPFLPAEVELLRRYLLDRAGRLSVYLSPTNNAGLTTLFEDWGIRADDMVIFETGSAFIGSAGSFLIRRFSEHPMTDTITKNDVFLVSGVMRPVRPDPAAPIDERLKVQPLLFSSDSSWGEAGYHSGGTPSFDAATDLPGPVMLGALAERRAASQLGIQIPGGRVLAIGSGDLLANRRLSSSLGNQLFLFSQINWLLERDQTLALPPRKIESFQFNLSQAELKRLAITLLIIPLLIGVQGLVIIWIRKF